MWRVLRHGHRPSYGPAVRARASSKEKENGNSNTCVCAHAGTPAARPRTADASLGHQKAPGLRVGTADGPGRGSRRARRRSPSGLRFPVSVNREHTRNRNLSSRTQNRSVGVGEGRRRFGVPGRQAVGVQRPPRRWTGGPRHWTGGPPALDRGAPGAPSTTAEASGCSRLCVSLHLRGLWVLTHCVLSPRTPDTCTSYCPLCQSNLNKTGGRFPQIVHVLSKVSPFLVCLGFGSPVVVLSDTSVSSLVTDVRPLRLLHGASLGDTVLGRFQAFVGDAHRKGHRESW